MGSPNSFKLPEAFLNQLREFSTGYFLVTVNAQGEFESFLQADNPVTRLGLLKFSKLIVGAMEKNMERSISIPPSINAPDIPVAEDEADDDDDDGSESASAT